MARCNVARKEENVYRFQSRVTNKQRAFLETRDQATVSVVWTRAWLFAVRRRADLRCVVGCSNNLAAVVHCRRKPAKLQLKACLWRSPVRVSWTGKHRLRSRNRNWTNPSRRRCCSLPYGVQTDVGCSEICMLKPRPDRFDNVIIWKCFCFDCTLVDYSSYHTKYAIASCEYFARAYGGLAAKKWM